MSQLTAHIVFATFNALDDAEKDKFVRLLNEKENKRGKTAKKPKRKSVYDKLPPKFHPDNLEMLVAEIMHEE